MLENAVAWPQVPDPPQPQRPPNALVLARWMGPRLVRKVALRLAMTITKRGPGWQWRTAIRADVGGGPAQRLGGGPGSGGSIRRQAGSTPIRF